MVAYQSYYEILGLDAPPEDRKTVKRAYSKLLKVTRPEDDPDGFMRLRNAHDTAMNVLARQAEQAKLDAQPTVQTPDAKIIEDQTERMSEPPSPDPTLTYEDMLPDTSEDREVEDATYALGPTPIMDAPVTFAEPEPPKAPPLIEDIEALLSRSENYNDRENWNQLFRRACRLDIDDYVDFEHLLMDAILNFHGFYDDHPDFDTPEKMPQKLSPSITASLFKTMSWDQVNTHGYNRVHQIEWLTRRMQLRKRGAEAVPIPQTNDDGNWKIWAFLICGFALLKLVQALVNS